VEEAEGAAFGVQEVHRQAVRHGYRKPEFPVPANQTVGPGPVRGTVAVHGQNLPGMNLGQSVNPIWLQAQVFIQILPGRIYFPVRIYHISRGPERNQRGNSLNFKAVKEKRKLSKGTGKIEIKRVNPHGGLHVMALRRFPG
jgi:hypothetical protein